MAALRSRCGHYILSLWFTYYGFVKTNGSHSGILLPVSIFVIGPLATYYDVVKNFNMAAVDVANQLPIPVW